MAPGYCASPHGPVLASAFSVCVFGLRTHYICGKNVFATYCVWYLSRLSEPINDKYPRTTVQGSRTLREPRVGTSLGVMSKRLLRSLDMGRWGDGLGRKQGQGRAQGLWFGASQLLSVG